MILETYLQDAVKWKAQISLGNKLSYSKNKSKIRDQLY